MRCAKPSRRINETGGQDGMEKNWSLRSHVAMLVATMVVAVAVVMAAVSVSRSEARLTERAGASLARSAASLSDQLDSDMRARQAAIVGLSSIPAILDPATGRRVADGMREAEPALAWLGILDPSGRVLSSTHGMLTGADVSSRPVYAEGIKGLFLGDAHPAVMLAKLVKAEGYGGDAETETRFVDISAPILSLSNQTLGVVAAHFDLGWVQRKVHHHEERAGNGTQMQVVGADGGALSGGTASSLSQTAKGDAGRLNRRNSTGWRREMSSDGTIHLVGYATGGPFGWTVQARQPLSLAIEPAIHLRYEILFCGAAMAAVFSLIGWCFAGILARPLHRIANAAERIRAGDVSEQLPEVGGNAEVQTLSRSLRGLMDALGAQDQAITVLRHTAGADALTQLANRRTFEAHLATLTANPSRGRVSIFYIDLDDFKPVNDRFGHAAGDEVLRVVAKRIRACLRPTDLAARLGGDEFAAILDPTCGKHEYAAIARRILATVATPILVDGNEIKIGCCIGVAHWPSDGPSLLETLEAADRALYAAKRSGKGAVSFAEDKPGAG